MIRGAVDLVAFMVAIGARNRRRLRPRRSILLTVVAPTGRPAVEISFGGPR